MHAAALDLVRYPSVLLQLPTISDHHRFGEINHFHFEGVCKPEQDGERRLCLREFQSGHERAMYSRSVGEFFLTDFEAGAASLDLCRGGTEDWEVLCLSHVRHCGQTDSFMHPHIWYKTHLPHRSSAFQRVGPQGSHPGGSRCICKPYDPNKAQASSNFATYWTAGVGSRPCRCPCLTRYCFVLPGTFDA